MYIDDTMKAVPILEKVKKSIDGFEVVNGSMDDVFLNATGKTLDNN